MNHHPADSLLADYAGGRMRPGFDLVLAAHLERCPRCRGRVGLFEAVAAELVETLPAEPLSEDALPHLMARLEREPARDELPTEPRDTRTLVERLPLGRRRRLAPGVWVQPVDVPMIGDDRIYLLRVGAGLQGLHHGHHGAELTVVLEGSLHDDEKLYAAGDFSENDSEVVHRPRAGTESHCLCLIASEGRIRPLDLIGRAIQALAGV